MSVVSPSAGYERAHADAVLRQQGFYPDPKGTGLVVKFCPVCKQHVNGERDLVASDYLLDATRLIDGFNEHVRFCPRVEDPKHYDGMGAE